MAMDELIQVSLRAAVDLIQTHDSGLTESAVKTRMERIAEDLLYAVNNKEATK